MNRLMCWLTRFMQGRYGIDKLFYGFFVLAIAIGGVNIFVHSLILRLIVDALTVLAILRLLSRNKEKRSEENRKFCSILDKITGKFTLCKRMFKDRKTHCYVKCSNCKKILRLPKKKGVHTVKCPNCHDSFQVKI